MKTLTEKQGVVVPCEEFERRRALREEKLLAEIAEQEEQKKISELVKSHRQQQDLKQRLLQKKRTRTIVPQYYFRKRQVSKSIILTERKQEIWERKVRAMKSKDVAKNQEEFAERMKKLREELRRSKVVPIGTLKELPKLFVERFGGLAKTVVMQRPEDDAGTQFFIETAKAVGFETGTVVRKGHLEVLLYKPYSRFDF